MERNDPGGSVDPTSQVFKVSYSWVSFSIDSVGYDKVVQIMFIGFHGI